MTIAALIFDVDGTLAETEEAHRQAFNETFSLAGLDWHWDRATYAKLLTTTGGKERMQRHRETLGSRRPDDTEIARLHAIKTRRYGDLLSAGGLKLRPGISQLIQSARAAGLRLAVATTTSRANVETLCRCCWETTADQVFEVIAAGDEVQAKKPAPDVYQLALSRLDLPPEAALAFEDSRNGLLSAMTCGIPAIITPSSYTSHEDFTGAAQIVSNLDGWRMPVSGKRLHDRLAGPDRILTEGGDQIIGPA